MFEIYGKNYIIDFDALEEHTLIKESIVQGDSKISRNKINTVKTDVIDNLLNKVIFSESIDEKIGFKGSDVTVGFVLALNTLIKYKIIKPNE